MTTPRWDLQRLFLPPAVMQADGFRYDGMDAVFFDTLPWKGQPTRTFAWIGLPANASSDAQVPGIVLVHGGGGTAFPAWVQLWNKRGYAAIAIDTCGCTPGHPKPRCVRHEMGGPPGWGGWEQMNDAVEDQWMYHAIADVILAHSLLRDRPEVDGDRVALAGISWGGILAANVVGLDQRFACASLAYGCGFLGQWDSIPEWLNDSASDPTQVARWKHLWDGKHRLPNAHMPLHWINGADDIAFSLPSVYESSRVARGACVRTFKQHLKHSHSDGWAPEEIGAFINVHCGINGVELPAFVNWQVKGGRVTSQINAPAGLHYVEMIHTNETGPWRSRQWQVARVHTSNDSIDVALPEHTGLFINITDQRSMVSTSPMLGNWFDL